MDTVKIGGLYRHFKGEEIVVLDKVTHIETGEELVIYMHNEKKWARPIGMFFENVLVDGKCKPRYEYLGQFSNRLQEKLAREMKKLNLSIYDTAGNLKKSDLMFEEIIETSVRRHEACFPGLREQIKASEKLTIIEEE